MKIIFLIFFIFTLRSVEGKSLEKAISALIKQYNYDNSLNTHFMTSRTDSLSSDFLKTIHERCNSVTIGYKMQKRNQIVIIFDLNEINIVKRADEFYLIVLTPNDNASSIFKSIWEKSTLINVDVIMEKENSVELLTFFPFSKKNCNNTNSVKVINEFRSEKWKENNFYPNKLSNFHECPLRLGVLPIYPAANEKILQNGSVTFFGSDIEICAELSKRLNFRQTISKGSYYGIQKQITQGKIDYAAGWFFLVSWIKEILDFAQPYFFIPVVVIVPPGAPYSSLENVIRTFSPILWIVFISFVFAFYILVKCIDKFSRIRNYFFESKEKFNTLLIFIIIIGDGTHKMPKRSTFRIILMSFILTCLVLRTAYQSAMFKFLQSDAHHRHIERFEEIEEMQYDLYVPHYFEYLISLKELKIKRKFIKNVTDENESNFIFKMNNPNMKAALTEPLDFVMRKMNENKTSFIILREPLSTIPVTIYFKRNSFLTKIFSDLIQDMIASGLIEYWIKNETRLSTSKEVQYHGPKVMTIHNLLAPFILCITGLFIASLVFMLELIYHKCDSIVFKRT